MSLARFFDESNRPLGNIPVSDGYLISAPKYEGIAEQVYERVSALDKPSLIDVKKLSRKLIQWNNQTMKILMILMR
jgi:hypothetical protein